MNRWQEENQKRRITSATYPQRDTIHVNVFCTFPVTDGEPKFVVNDGEVVKV